MKTPPASDRDSYPSFKDVVSVPGSAIRAVLSKDMTMLQEAVGQGHAHVVVQVKMRKSAPVADRSLVLLAIDQDWLEGLKVLLAAGPAFTSANVAQWKEQALRQGSATVLEYFLAQFPDAFLGEWEEPGYLERALINGMGRPSGYSAPLGVLGVDKALRAHGWDTRSLVPGEFEKHDISTAGHNVWTAALLRQRWALAMELWPAISGVEPYLDVQADAVVKERSSSYSMPAGTGSWQWEAHPLIRVQSPEEIARLPRLPEGLEAARHAVLEDDEEAKAVLGRWWQEAPGVVPLPLGQAATSPADWLVIAALSATARQRIWQLWDSVQSEDGVTPMHVFAQAAGTPAARALLKVIEQDQPACFARWHQPTRQGLTPAQLWGEVMPYNWEPQWIEPTSATSKPSRSSAAKKAALPKSATPKATPSKPVAKKAVAKKAVAKKAVAKKPALPKPAKKSAAKKAARLK